MAHPAHVRVSHFAGVLECDICGRWWSFKLPLERVPTLHGAHSRCCRARMAVLDGTIVALIDINCGSPDLGGLE